MAEVLTLSRVRMAEVLNVHRCNVGRWVKAKKFDKVPPGWVWSDKDKVFKYESPIEYDA